MDRYLYCQLALRNVRGLPPGRLLPWLIRHLPQPDLVVLFDISASRLSRGSTIAAPITSRWTTCIPSVRPMRLLPEYPGFARVAAEHSPAEPCRNSKR